MTYLDLEAPAQTTRIPSRHVFAYILTSFCLCWSWSAVWRQFSLGHPAIRQPAGVHLFVGQV